MKGRFVLLHTDTDVSLSSIVGPKEFHVFDASSLAYLPMNSRNVCHVGIGQVNVQISHLPHEVALDWVGTSACRIESPRISSLAWLINHCPAPSSSPVYSSTDITPKPVNDGAASRMGWLFG